MEKPRMNTQHVLESPTLSKTQQKKRRRRKYPNVFFKKELIPLFDTIDNPKTMAASFLTFFCALRLSEVSRLEWKDIDLQEARLKVVDGKNHKDGFIPISPLAIPILKKWREMNPNENYFLPSDNYSTGHYQSDSLFKDYKKSLRKAGLLVPTDKNSAGAQQHQYKFHTLRHSRCTHLLSNGVPLEKVQKFMRHDKIETTMTYTWIMDKEMNKMVAKVDTGAFDELLPTNEQPNSEPQKIDAMSIAQKRLACGEITLREYQKIARALTSV